MLSSRSERARVAVSLHESGVELIGEGDLESGFLKAQIQKTGTGEEREDSMGRLGGWRSVGFAHELINRLDQCLLALKV